MRVKISSDENKYFTSYFDEDLNLYELYWHKVSEEMEDEEYKLFMSQERDYLIEAGYRLDALILDNREFLFSMSPDLQEWQAGEILAKMLEKNPNPNNAIIVSSDFISQLSIEQAMEENEKAENTTRYFENELEAKEWILGL